jgi:hypothetical protein
MATRLFITLIPALAVGAVAFGAEGLASSGRAAPQAPPAASPFKPVATPKEIMLVITVPASDKIFDFSAEPPKDEDGWSMLRLYALAVAETSNLLVMPGRAPDQAPEWNQYAAEQLAAALAVAKAAEAKDADKMMAASNELYEICGRCHDQYMAGAK